MEKKDLIIKRIPSESQIYDEILEVKKIVTEILEIVKEDKGQK